MYVEIIFDIFYAKIMGFLVYSPPGAIHEETHNFGNSIVEEYDTGHTNDETEASN